MQLQLITELNNVLHVYKTRKWTPRWFKLAQLTRRVLNLLKRRSLDPWRLRELMRQWTYFATPIGLGYDLLYAVDLAAFRQIRAMGL